MALGSGRQSERGSERERESERELQSERDREWERESEREIRLQHTHWAMLQGGDHAEGAIKSVLHRASRGYVMAAGSGMQRVRCRRAPRRLSSCPNMFNLKDNSALPSVGTASTLQWFIHV